MKTTLAVLLFAATQIIHAADRDLPVKAPPADQILATLRKPHPRLLATTRDFDELKQLIQTDSFLKSWYGKLKSEADDLLDAPP